MPSLKNQVRAFQQYLVEVGRTYHQSIPVTQILEALGPDLQAVDDDGEPWAGLLCGREGFALIGVQAMGKTFKTLVLRWYRMGSGNYEVVGYLS